MHPGRAQQRRHRLLTSPQAYSLVAAGLVLAVVVGSWSGLSRHGFSSVTFQTATSLTGKHKQPLCSDTCSQPSNHRKTSFKSPKPLSNKNPLGGAKAYKPTNPFSKCWTPQIMDGLQSWACSEPGWFTQCTLTASEAKNGICQDGSQAPAKALPVPVMCDLGTDCSDCGPWTGDHVSWGDKEAGPVAYIASQNATIAVRRTETQPSFLMAVTRGLIDPDVSYLVENHGIMEGGVTRVVHEILAERCVGAGGNGALVLDVGANMGYYALYAAMYGCRVIAWEPVELFRAYLHHSIALNNLSHLIEVRPRIVSDVPGNLPIGVPKDKTYWGLASVHNINLHPHEVREVISAPSQRLDDVVHEDVLLLKADVEGYEPHVLASAQKLFAKHKVENVLLEYSPGVFERSKDDVAFKNNTLMLQQLTQMGYAIGHLPMSFSKPWPPTGIAYNAPLPAFEEVTAESLKCDLEGAQLRLDTKAKGCQVPEVLQKKNGVWSCGDPAYAIHPKGFRSSFGYNTDVWASLSFKRLAPKPGSGFSMPAAPAKAGTGLLKLQGVSSLFAPEQDMKVWPSLARPGISFGLQPCNQAGVGHRLIFHCNCSQPDACGEEEALVKQLAAQGLMPFTGS